MSEFGRRRCRRCARIFHHEFEEAFIDRGLTNSDVLRLLERAEERAKWKQ
jgi:hypothetical protein